MAQGVLAGIRVLDFGRFIAGPFCGALLADHGADVIRIEKVGGSEDRAVLPLAPTGEGGLYLQMNRGKRSLTLDPAAAQGREIVRRLVARCDVVIANMPQATLAAIGLNYAALAAINPRVILVATNAFGKRGPAAGKLGFDGIGQAISGAIYMSGDPGAPRRAAVPYVDFGTASLAAFGTLLALMARERTGRGQEVSGSLVATALTMTNAGLIEQAITKPDRVPQGNLGYASAPADLFKCGDGNWIIAQAVGQPLWERFCGMLGAPEWLADERFRDDGARGENGRLVSARLREWCAARTREEVLRTFEKARIPAGMVHSPQQALDDPMLAAAGFFVPLDFPGMPAPAPVVNTPVALSETPGALRGRAPTYSEHTEEILREIGFSAAEIQALRVSKVI